MSFYNQTPTGTMDQDQIREGLKNGAQSSMMRGSDRRADEEQQEEFIVNIDDGSQVHMDESYLASE